MDKKYKNCQSCGMPIKYDPQKGGTNSDNSISTKYCSYCYVQGNFTQADFTVEQMQEFCLQKMIEMKYPRFIAKIFTRNIPKLERWKIK